MGYLWDDSDRPALMDMAVTGALSDVGVDDQTTGVAAADTASGWGGGCPAPLLEVDAYLTAVYSPAELTEFTDLRFTRKAFISDGGFGSECNVLPEDPPTDDGEDWAIERSLVADPGPGDWISVATGSVASADDTFRTTEHTETFIARHVRLVLHAFLDKPRINTGDWTINVLLTDFRLTGEPASCPVPDPPTIRAEGSIVLGVPRITIYGNE